MQNTNVVDEEVLFDDGVIVSETDLKGVITYANRKFAKISGYEKSELLGEPHNILRHPDMPKHVFKQMWDQLKEKGEWDGVVKNLRKDGRYYWVKAYVETVYDENGNKKGYRSARKVPERYEVSDAIEQYRCNI